jgi:hypothetical protein
MRGVIVRFCAGVRLAGVAMPAFFLRDFFAKASSSDELRGRFYKSVSAVVFGIKPT